MARRMSTRAGMRSGEQLTSEDALEATPDEKVEDADEATEAAEATADEKAEATAVGLGTAGRAVAEGGHADEEQPPEGARGLRVAAPHAVGRRLEAGATAGAACANAGAARLRIAAPVLATLRLAPAPCLAP